MKQIGKVFYVHNNFVKVKIKKDHFQKNSDKYLITKNGELIEINGINSFFKISNSNLMIIFKLNKQLEELDYIIFEGNIVGSIQNGSYKVGIANLPSLFDSVFFIEKEDLDIIKGLSDKKNKFVIGWDNSGNEILINCNTFLNSHNGIFGATGQGKSYTLSNLITGSSEFLLNKNLSKKIEYLIFDTNGEYSNEAFRNKYRAEILSFNENVYIEFDESNIEFLYLIFNASPKTQKPFLNSLILRSDEYLDLSFINQHILMAHNSKSSGGYSRLKQIGSRMELLKNLISNLDNDFYKVVSIISEKINEFNSPEYYGNVNSNSLNFNLDFEKLFLNRFEYFILLLNINPIDSEYQSNHIEPIIKRITNNYKIWSKIFDVDQGHSFDKLILDSEMNGNFKINVFNLSLLTFGVKKTIMKFMLEKIYFNQRQKFLNYDIKKNRYLFIDEIQIIDDVEETYEDDILEQILREGRKFKLFVTYSTQRPSSLNETIISQTSNLFIHKLKNYRDYNSLKPFITQFNINEIFLFFLGIGEIILIGDVTNDYEIVKINIPIIPPLKEDDIIFSEK